MSEIVMRKSDLKMYESAKIGMVDISTRQTWIFSFVLEEKNNLIAELHRIIADCLIA